MSKTQAALSTFAPATDTVDVTRTIRLKLQTSQAKLAQVQTGIDAYQSVLSFMADHVVSYPEYDWEPAQNTHMYHHAQEGLPEDDVNYRTTLAQDAQQQVVESFKSWRERGKPGNRPRGEFGNADWLGLRGDCVTVAENDRGFGVKTNFISYKPLWFHISAGDYQREFLQRIVDEDDPLDCGRAELHRNGDTVYCHLTVTWPVETYAAPEVNTVVGVDLNTDPLAVGAVWSDTAEGVEGVHFESGAEFRHYRQRMKRRKNQAMADDNLKAITDARRDYRRYTDHMTHNVSRHIVDLATDVTPCRIQLEDLTHYRTRSDDAIHDWPFAKIQEQIISKAKEEGIPVLFVDPRDTSRRCRKCGTVADVSRDGREFACIDCGYQVHADVNAAINIAQRDA